MIRFASITLLSLSLSSSLAMAGTFAIPAKHAVATVDIPDSWSPKALSSGVEARSDDDEIYLALELVSAADVNSAMQEGVDLLLKRGLKIDAQDVEIRPTKVGDLDASSIRFTGEHNNRPTNMRLTLVATYAADKFLLLYYWGSAKSEQQNTDSLQAIADSIQIATK